MTQLIDLGKLRFHFAGDWSSSTTYESNDIVKYGGNVYVYTYGLKTSGHLPTDTDFWALMVEGIKFKGAYSTGTAYKVGDGVAHGGKVYIAIADTTGNTPPNVSYWSQFADGIQYEGVYSGSAQYQRNDVVSYGASAYIAKQDTSGNDPTNGTFWAKLVEGVSATGAWNGNTAYVPGDVVAYGANLYKATANNTNQLPIDSAGTLNASFWQLFNTGIRSRGDWTTATEYFINDVVSYGGNTFICVVRNASTTFAADLAANKWQKFNSGIRWRGAWATGTAYLKDDVVKDGVGSAYIAKSDHTAGSAFATDLGANRWEVFVLGGSDVLPAIQANDVGQSLTVLPNGSIDWIGATQSANVFYVAPHGADTTANGRNLAAPFASIKYACQQAPAGSTIFVKTGTYSEQLPITVPANVAIVGDNQRTTIVQPAAGNSDDGTTPNNQSTMFLMSNGSILNKMTFVGMTGWVPGTTAEDVTTSTIRGVVVRMNPASPVTTKSPYVLECSAIGSGLIGALVDGTAHNSGYESMIFHGYTVISDNGIGYWVKDGAKAEIVSCFTYYCYFGYTASGGGQIRALNGNNSYGTWGATSRGFNANETPVTGAILGRQLNFVYQGGNINVGDTVTSSSGATATVTNVQTTANKVYVQNATGTFAQGNTLTFTSGGTGTVSAGALEDQKGFVLVMNNLTARPRPGQSIQIAGDSFAYVVQSVSGSYTNASSVIAVVLAQEKPTGSASGAVVTLRSMYSQIRLTGHDFLSIGTGGVTTTNYPGMPTQPAAQGNETDEAFPGRVFYVSTDQDGNFRVGEYFRIDQATGRATLNASAFDLAGLTSLRLGSIGAQLGETINEFSSDGTLSGNSNLAVPTEQAVKSYVDGRVPQAIPSSVGQTGRVLVSQGNAVGWQAVEALPEQTYVANEILFTDGVAAYWDSPTQIVGQNTFSFVNGASFASRTYTATSLTTVNPTFSWSVTPDSLPPGITAISIDNSGVLTMAGTFTANGAYNLTVNATDGRFIGRLRIRIFVAATAVIPVFSTNSIAVTNRSIPGQAFTTSSFAATNTGGGITYAVTGGFPSWMTFNTSTGVFSGTAPTLDAPTRVYNLTVSATAGGVTVIKNFLWTFTSQIPQGQALFGVNTGPGTFNWVAPEGVTSVSVVAVGSGGWGSWSWSGGGQGGGGLGWKNNIPVVPGQSYTVQVANFGSNSGNAGSNGDASHSFFISEATVCGRSGRSGGGGTFVGDGGGNGGSGGGGSWSTGGGGAGGYTGNGGNASSNANTGAGGGGNGAYSAYSSTWGVGGGGGVGLLGQGPSANGWNPSAVTGAGGNGGSGGAPGLWGETGSFGNQSCRGGDYGGGGGGSGTSTSNNSPYTLQARGGHGGVRIIWGPNRAFPATNTADVTPN